jgi:hypothetical protein
MYITAPEPISMAYLKNPSLQSVCLYVYPPIVARQWLGKNPAIISRQHLSKNITVATNTHTSFSILFVAY